MRRALRHLSLRLSGLQGHQLHLHGAVAGVYLAQITLGLVGPAPGVCVLLIWMILNLTYCGEALRLQRRGRE